MKRLPARTFATALPEERGSWRPKRRETTALTGERWLALLCARGSAARSRQVFGCEKGCDALALFRCVARASARPKGRIKERKRVDNV